MMKPLLDQSAHTKDTEVNRLLSQTSWLVFAGFIFLITNLICASAHASFTAIDPPQKLPPLIFEDENGAQHALSEYRGGYVLLNVWATWCGPCVKEMPSLDALQTKFDIQKLLILPLSEDRGEGTVPVFYRAHNITHLPTVIDHAGTAPSVLRLGGLPTSFLIDPQGNAIARIEGEADWSSADMLHYLQLQTGTPASKPSKHKK